MAAGSRQGVRMRRVSMVVGALLVIGAIAFFAVRQMNLAGKPEPAGPAMQSAGAGAATTPAAGASAPAASTADPAALYPDDLFLGSPDAKVTIIEYASLSCPHCAKFN